MADRSPASSGATPITIRAAKDRISELDAIAAATDRSRNYIINKAIEDYLDTHAWQMERIQAGIEDARAGRVHPAEEVHAAIAAKYGWKV